MSEDLSLPLWAESKAKICDQIRAVAGKLKIVLKSRNEVHLLQSWIDHHVKIAGKKNVIVMDNCSDDPAVLKIYRDNAEDVLAFSYSDHHNSLHRIALYEELYDALRRSSEFYVFIDTDEFLFWHDGERLLSGLEFTNKMVGGGDFYPGIWLHNYPGCKNIFFISDYVARTLEGLTWGKPIISSRVEVGGFINHNCQLKGSVTNLVPRYGVFVAHFNRLIPQQRINQNIQKLISRKLIRQADEIDNLLNEPGGSSDGNIDLYIREIKSLRALSEGAWPSLNNPPLGTAKLRSDGTLVWADDRTRDAFLSINLDFLNLWTQVSGIVQ
jgi:Glycosyl transferase family 2